MREKRRRKKRARGKPRAMQRETVPTSSALVTELALPRDNARPIGIAVDADNNVWYADLAGWIGKLPVARARAQ